MKKTHLHTLLALLLLAITGRSTAELEGLTLVTVKHRTKYELTSSGTFDKTESSEAPETLYLTSDHAHQQFGDGYLLVEVKGDGFTHVHRPQRQFSHTTRKQLRRAYSRVEAKTETSFAAWMVARRVSEVTTETGTEERTIAGYPCEHHVLSTDIRLRFDVWVTRESAASPGHREAFWLAHEAMRGPLAIQLEKVFAELRKLDGLPLAYQETLLFAGHPIAVDLIEATQLTFGPLPAGVFEVPRGYRKSTSPFR